MRADAGCLASLEIKSSTMLEPIVTVAECLRDSIAALVGTIHGFGGPVDSRSERGVKRGKHSW